MFLVLLVAICVAGGAALGWASNTLRDLPTLNTDILSNQPQASTIYDRHGNEICKLSTDQNFRETVSYTEIPRFLRDALVASEDRKFYDHFGVDLAGVARMVLMRGEMGGGSTITQQLVRNVWLSPDVTLERKLREMVLAIRLEQLISKDEILYYYLNQVFFGHWAKGIQAAAKLYFGKGVSELNLAESAMLIGLLPAPNEYSPYEDYQAAKRGQAIVLDLMLDQGKITLNEANEAKATPLEFVGLEKVQEAYFTSTYFSDFVIRNFPLLLADYFGGEALAREALYNGGLHIYTTLDTQLQLETERLIAEVIQTNQIDNGNLRWAEKQENGIYERQVATVVVESATGEIVVMIGGREYPEDESFVWNRAVDSLRQPGSCIKPLIDYAPALQRKSVTLGTVFDDVPTAWGTWHPLNYDNAYFGLIPVREAIARSQNIPAIKTLQEVGVHNGIDFMRKLGFTTLTDDDLFLPSAIGGLSQGVSVLDMTMAYAAFMNEGIYTHPVYVKEVLDRNRLLIYSAEPRQTVVLDKQSNYLVLDALKTAVTLPYGTSRVGNLGRPTAAKTGTTDDFFDLWFCGGTPDYTSAIWIGHDINSAMNDLYSSGIHPRIWREYMAMIHEGLPERDWTQPSDMVRVPICTVSGRTPSDICPSYKRTTELYIKGTEPSPYVHCNVHVIADIDTSNGLLATPRTPAALVATKVFIRRPVPLPNPLPYGRYPADAGEEVPTQLSPNVAEEIATPLQPGGNVTPFTPGSTAPTT
ncbi:MAG: penicillin-binding protein, partial [Symbiobacteriaceae bacterium]|nr:penicillin-binding protein [Symbiobacteriaceae bacterium]